MSFALTAKPPVGTPIDWAHPIARGLSVAFPINEGIGGKSIRDAVTGQMATFANSPPGVVLRNGVRVFCGWDQSFNSEAVHFPIGIPGIFDKQPVTILARYEEARTDGYGGVASISGASSTPAGLGYGGTLGLLQFKTINGGGGTGTNVQFSVATPNAPHQYGGTLGINGQVLYVDGVAVASDTSAGAYTYPFYNTDHIEFPATNFSGGGHGWFTYLYMWKRALSAAEIASIYADPYQFFASTNRKRLNRFAYIAASAGPNNASGGVSFFFYGTIAESQTNQGSGAASAAARMAAQTSQTNQGSGGSSMAARTSAAYSQINQANGSISIVNTSSVAESQTNIAQIAASLAARLGAQASQTNSGSVDSRAAMRSGASVSQMNVGTVTVNSAVTASGNSGNINTISGGVTFALNLGAMLSMVNQGAAAVSSALAAALVGVQTNSGAGGAGIGTTGHGDVSQTNSGAGGVAAAHAASGAYAQVNIGVGVVSAAIEIVGSVIVLIGRGLRSNIGVAPRYTCTLDMAPRYAVQVDMSPRFSSTLELL